MKINRQRSFLGKSRNKQDFDKSSGPLGALSISPTPQNPVGFGASTHNLSGVSFFRVLENVGILPAHHHHAPCSFTSDLASSLFHPFPSSSQSFSNTSLHLVSSMLTPINLTNHNHKPNGQLKSTKRLYTPTFIPTQHRLPSRLHH
jgi:hypothetical protein